MKRVAIGLAVLVALAYGWWKIPNRWWYRDGRPTRFGKLTNDFMAAAYKVGFTPRFMPALEVRKRRTGEPEQIPVVVADYGGERYLVSMLGEKSAWVKNVRAAGGDASLLHRGRHPVHLSEVPVDNRAPVLQAYLRRAVGARPHFPIPPSAPLEDFEALAHEYPVFHIEERRPGVEDVVAVDPTG
jgi:hypothetical protein